MAQTSHPSTGHHHCPKQSLLSHSYLCSTVSPVTRWTPQQGLPGTGKKERHHYLSILGWCYMQRPISVALLTPCITWDFVFHMTGYWKYPQNWVAMCALNTMRRILFALLNSRVDCLPQLQWTTLTITLVPPPHNPHSMVLEYHSSNIRPKSLVVLNGCLPAEVYTAAR